MVRHHFTPCVSAVEAFERLRSIQFDPIAPVGCNHDLVLQARVPGYKVGDWQTLAYEARHVYDGWDKMASLVPFEGWPLRRIFYKLHRRGFEEKIFGDHKDAVDAILSEITKRGPLLPRDFDYQARKDEWKGSWFGPSVTKQSLRALWHSGIVMTAGRKNGQHLYDLTERVVPENLRKQPVLDDVDAQRELVMERHRAMGIVRPTAPPEIWSYHSLMFARKEAIPALVQEGRIVPVDVAGVKAHATPAFLRLLDEPSLEPRVLFVAPLDQFMWDRKMIAHLFGFDYSWEIYTPLAKRRWGYYVLPILFGDALVARVEFYCRGGILEMREWHFEDGKLESEFWGAFESSMKDFMNYSSANRASVSEHIERSVRDMMKPWLEA
jgi:uncharacterized protein